VTVRLRQAVLAAAELEPVADALQAELGLGEPYADPGVAAFGLENAVFAIGDCFLEVVSPTAAGTAAGRHLERRGGDCGYMLIFQFDDLDAARERAAALGVRVVWQIDLPDIAGTHLHPADTGGAIVSLDRADPPGSWRWGGPDWTEREGPAAPGRLEAVTLRVPDPEAVAARWEELLGVPLAEAGVTFLPQEADGPEGLAEIAVAVPPEVRQDRDSVHIGGVRFRLRDSGA
jgi:predicted enzyme related to lactoylglutathione lyase